jgi:hypothetical protein
MGDRGFGLQTGLNRQGFSAAGEADMWGGGFRVGQSGGGWTAHEQRPSQGVVLGKKGLKRKRVEQRGERSLLYSSKAAADLCMRVARSRDY